MTTARKLIAVVGVVTALSVAIPYGAEKQRTAYFAGPGCQTNPNFNGKTTLLVTGQKRINEALEELAVFSCNKFSSNVPDSWFIDTGGYEDMPWQDIAHKICVTNHVRCWAIEGTFHAKKASRYKDGRWERVE